MYRSVDQSSINSLSGGVGKPAGKHGSKIPKLPLKIHKTRYEAGKRIRQVDASDITDSELESCDELIVPPPASERVKFILGGDDGESVTSNQKTPQLFTELEELFVCLDGKSEWKETARWFKYEEDVEEGGDRWSKPHIATLSLYSILELRSSLIAGTVILDMEASNLVEISDLVIDNLISCNKLEEIYRVKVRDTLLRRHVHQRSSGFNVLYD
jgi:hypothetical protein